MRDTDSGGRLLGGLETVATEARLPALDLAAALNALPCHRGAGFQVREDTTCTTGSAGAIACTRMRKRPATAPR